MTNPSSGLTLDRVAMEGLLVYWRPHPMLFIDISSGVLKPSCPRFHPTSTLQPPVDHISHIFSAAAGSTSQVVYRYDRTVVFFNSPLQVPQSVQTKKTLVFSSLFGVAHKAPEI